MATTPRPWYRSPALWFFLPGLIFILWAWFFSMQRVTNLDLQIGGTTVRLRHDGSTVGASWHETRGSLPPGAIPKRFHFDVTPRSARARMAWFPLPSYVVNRMVSPPSWHYLKIPHWLLLLVYIGLWQLPWLARYHRRRRIDHSLARVPTMDPQIRE